MKKSQSLVPKTEGAEAEPVGEIVGNELHPQQGQQERTFETVQVMNRNGGRERRLPNKNGNDVRKINRCESLARGDIAKKDVVVQETRASLRKKRRSEVLTSFGQERSSSSIVRLIFKGRRKEGGEYAGSYIRGEIEKEHSTNRKVRFNPSADEIHIVDVPTESEARRLWWKNEELDTLRRESRSSMCKDTLAAYLQASIRLHQSVCSGSVAVDPSLMKQVRNGFVAGYRGIEMWSSHSGLRRKENVKLIVRAVVEASKSMATRIAKSTSNAAGNMVSPPMTKATAMSAGNDHNSKTTATTAGQGPGPMITVESLHDYASKLSYCSRMHALIYGTVDSMVANAEGDGSS